MILPGKALADAVLHQPGKRGQHADGRIEPLLVHIPIEHNLSFGDISGQVRDRMGDIVVWHGQDRRLGDAARLALQHSGPLIEGSQIGIEVGGIPLSAGDFIFGGGKFPQSLAIGGHIRHNDQNVHSIGKGQIFRRRQGAAGRQNPLDDGVAGLVDEHHHPLKGAGILKILLKKVGGVLFQPHAGEHDAELFILPAHLGLADDLGGQLVVAHACAGENRQLLAPNQGGHAVDGRDAGINAVARVFPSHGVHGHSVDIPLFLGVNLAQAVDGPARAGKHPAQHFSAQGQLHRPALERDADPFQRDALAALKNLKHNPVPFSHNHPAGPLFTAGQSDFGHFVIGRAPHPFQGQQRPVDFRHAGIFDSHTFASPWLWRVFWATVWAAA